MKLIQKRFSVDSAVRFHVYKVRRFRQSDFEQENSSSKIQEAFRKMYSCNEEKNSHSIAAPRRVHTAHHSGKKLRITLEKSAP